MNSITSLSLTFDTQKKYVKKKTYIFFFFFIYLFIFIEIFY